LAVVFGDLANAIPAMTICFFDPFYSTKVYICIKLTATTSTSDRTADRADFQSDPRLRLQCWLQCQPLLIDCWRCCFRLALYRVHSPAIRSRSSDSRVRQNAGADPRRRGEHGCGTYIISGRRYEKVLQNNFQFRLRASCSGACAKGGNVADTEASLGSNN
jgi:hypothetical protein